MIKTSPNKMDEAAVDLAVDKAYNFHDTVMRAVDIGARHRLSKKEIAEFIHGEVDAVLITEEVLEVPEHIRKACEAAGVGKDGKTFKKPAVQKPVTKIQKYILVFYEHQDGEQQYRDRIIIATKSHNDKTVEDSVKSVDCIIHSFFKDFYGTTTKTINKDTWQYQTDDLTRGVNVRGWQIISEEDALKLQQYGTTIHELDVKEGQTDEFPKSRSDTKKP